MIVETNYFGNFKQIDEPKVSIIPVPYEYTTSYVKGTKNGPQAILNASTRLEAFDDELWVDVSKIGINTSSFLNCDFVNDKTATPFAEVEEAVKSTVISGSLPIVIGGEHSITYGSIKAINDLYPETSILHFGSRCNLKSTYKENKYSHDCVFRRIYEMVPDIKIVHVGIRSLGKEAADWLEEHNPNSEIFFARDKNRWNVVDILSNLNKNVFISFDFSALDSSVMPTTAMPEPGGFSWEFAIDILKNVSAFKEIVGMDFVGFSPLLGFHAPEFQAAKLIYKTIGYSFARELGVFEESEPEAIASGN